MSKRPLVDLMALTSEAATPMPEAVQRKAPAPEPLPIQSAKNADLQGLNFKVPEAFRKRFHKCAFEADLFLNELLFEALDAWEQQRGAKS